MNRMQTAARKAHKARQRGSDLERAEIGHDAANSLAGGIAVLDSDRVVRWANQAWWEDVSAIPLDGATPFSEAIINAITAVLSGATSYMELRSRVHAGRPVRLAITPLRGGRGGVVIFAESIARHSAPDGAPLVIDAASIAERLTPRELDVLIRMATGLSNRAIANDLGIEYTTVRGYVQSVLSKLGAASRVDAVARAYRSGLVRETAS